MNADAAAKCGSCFVMSLLAGMLQEYAHVTACRECHERWLPCLDGQHAQYHAEWLGGRSKTLAKLRRIVFFENIPGNEVGELDLAIVSREDAVERQQEVSESEVVPMLASIHVNNSGRLFCGKPPIYQHVTVNNCSDTPQRDRFATCHRQC